MRIVLGALVLASLASAAAAQTGQPDLLKGVVASSENPMSAWQSSFNPQMVSALHTLSSDERLAKNCKPVMMTADKTDPTVAGAPLFAGTRCVVETRQNLHSTSAPNGGLQNKALATAGLKPGIAPATSQP